MKNEEEEIRNKKIAEMENAKKIEEQMKSALRFTLEESAFERIGNVRLANKELYFTAAQQIIAIYKKVGRKLNETEVLAILRAIKNQTENETKITFQRK